MNFSIDCAPMWSSKYSKKGSFGVGKCMLIVEAFLMGMEFRDWYTDSWESTVEQ